MNLPLGKLPLAAASSCALRIGAAAVSLVFLAGPACAQTSEFFFDPAGNLLAVASETGGLPQITGQPQMRVVMPGESAAFSVSVADTSGLTYQWFFNTTAIPGATGDSLVITNVSGANQGPYWVAVSNAVGSLGSRLANLYIDSRGCGMPDSWQVEYFGNLNQNPLSDYDGDGVSNLQEFLDGTNPTNAASALYRITLLNDGGTVTISPDQSTYTSGQVVTLTAITTSSPFHAWTGDVLTRSSSIMVTMTNNLTLFAHFLPFTFVWTNLANGDWNVPSNWSPNLAPGNNESVIIGYAYPGTGLPTITENSNVDLVDFTFGNSSFIPVLTGSGRITISGTGIWNSGTMSGTGTTVVQPGASLLLANSSGLALNNRTLENAGSVVWVGGSFSLGGVVTNDAGAQFQFVGPASLNYGGGAARFDNAGILILASNAVTAFVGVPFDNYGTVNFPSGTLTLSGGGFQGGTLPVPVDALLNLAGGTLTSSGNLSITGEGTLLVSGGIGTLAGTINVTGSNVFSSGSMDFTGTYIRTNAPLTISGCTVSFDGTSVVAPTVLTLSGGSLGGSTDVTVGSGMTWTGGAMNGTGRTVISPGSTLNISNGGTLFLNSRTLDNGGMTLWTDGNLSMIGGVITNETGASFRLQVPASISFGGGAPRFDNAGTLLTAGGGPTTFGVAFNNYSDTEIQGGTLTLSGGGLNNGTMEVPAGATLNLGGITFTSSAGSSISGAGNFTASASTAILSGLVHLGGSNTFSAGTAELNGNYICTNNTMLISGGTANFDGSGPVSPAVLNLSSGALGGSNLVTVGSVMYWTGGSMIGTGRTAISPGATLTIANPSFLSISSRTLDNAGTAVWTGAGSLTLIGAVITNEPGALFQAQSPNFVFNGGGSPHIDNNGTLRITGAGAMSFPGLPLNNFSLVDIQGGTLTLGGGILAGVITVPAGTGINLGSGAYVSSGSPSITGAGTFIVSGGFGTLGGTINVSGSNIFSNGSMDFTGNYVCTNNVLVISGATASFDGTGPVSPAMLVLSGGTLGGSNAVTVGSQMNWTGGSMNGNGRTVISPAATLTIANPSFLSINNRTLDNGGTAFWTGAGNINLNAAVITNRTGALFNAQNAAPIFFGGGSPRIDNAGTFRKSVSTGTTTIGGSVPFANYGTVDIQSGFLAANGGYASSSNALLNCSIGGKTPGTNYGQLQVSGTVVLKGNLSVNLANGYFPATNDAFTLLIAGTRSNTFANFTYPSNIAAMQLSNTATSVIAQVTGVVSVPQPVLMQPVITASNILLTWTANQNFIYRLEYNPSLAPSNWIAVPGDVTTSGNTASKLDSLTSSNRYYRVHILP
jgi:hypothetical protein